MKPSMLSCTWPSAADALGSGSPHPGLPDFIEPLLWLNCVAGRLNELGI